MKPSTSEWVSKAPEWEMFRADLNVLTALGVEVRYPGMTADSEDASRAMKIAYKVRINARRSLNLNS